MINQRNGMIPYRTYFAMTISSDRTGRAFGLAFSDDRSKANDERRLAARTCAASGVNVKHTFAAEMPQNTTGFNPLYARDPGDPGKIYQKTRKFKTRPTPNIMVLATSANECHSILMIALRGDQPNEWCVGGIKMVPPMGYQAIELK
jgi:hypothetical protein